MPTAIRETALAAFFTRLQTMTGVAVERTPDFRFKASDLPAVAQFAGGHQAVDRNAPGITRLVRIRLDCGVKAATADLLEPAINDLHAKIVVAVMGDPQLGGLVDGYVREAEMSDPDFDDAGVPNSRFTLTFEFELTTSETSPYTQTLP